jgi:hypothetical protein
LNFTASASFFNTSFGVLYTPVINAFSCIIITKKYTKINK